MYQLETYWMCQAIDRELALQKAERLMRLGVEPGPWPVRPTWLRRLPFFRGSGATGATGALSQKAAGRCPAVHGQLAAPGAMRRP